MRHFQYKFILIASLYVSTLTSCNQQNDKAKIITKMAEDFCNCLNKDASSASIDLYDSCFVLNVKYNASSLRIAGFDTSIISLQKNIEFNKSLAENVKKICPEVQAKLKKEIDKNKQVELAAWEKESPTTFNGLFISQKKINNDEFEVVLKSKINNDIKTFISQGRVDAILPIKKGNEVFIEYEIVKNPMNNKDEFKIKMLSLVTGQPSAEVIEKKDY